MYPFNTMPFLQSSRLQWVEQTLHMFTHPFCLSPCPWLHVPSPPLSEPPSLKTPLTYSCLHHPPAYSTLDLLPFAWAQGPWVTSSLPSFHRGMDELRCNIHDEGNKVPARKQTRVLPTFMVLTMITSKYKLHLRIISGKGPFNLPDSFLGQPSPGALGPRECSQSPRKRRESLRL